MKTRTGMMFLTLFTGLALSSPIYAQHDEDTELRQRIAELESRIDALASQRSVASIDDDRAQVIRQLVSDVLDDASSRTSFLQGASTTAGWDGHPFLSSADGSLLLELSGRLQARYVFNHQDSPSDDTSRGGFEIRRMRITFTGHVIDPSWQYEMQLANDRVTGAAKLNNAFIRKDLEDGRYVRFGQFRPGFMRESAISSGRQQAVERSLVHSAFGVARTQGIELGMEGEHLAMRAMIHDGDGNANSPALMEDVEYAATARVEWLAAGTWKQFKDSTSWPDDPFGMMVGAAVATQLDEFGTASGPEVDDDRWTVDVSLEFGGANLYGSFVGRYLEDDASLDADQYGLLIQGGVFVLDDVELFARYEWADDDLSPDDLNVMTVGFNRYFAGHDLKWTTDVGYAFESVSDSFATSGAGWREDAAANADGQIVIRTQLQLQF